jgi:hypothetical protein
VKPLALPTNNRLGWKGLSGTNNLANNNSKLRLKTLAIVANVIKLFTVVSYDFSKKARAFAAGKPF